MKRCTPARRTCRGNTARSCDDERQRRHTRALTFFFLHRTFCPRILASLLLLPKTMRFRWSPPHGGSAPLRHSLACQPSINKHHHQGNSCASRRLPPIGPNTFSAPSRVHPFTRRSSLRTMRTQSFVTLVAPNPVAAHNSSRQQMRAEKRSTRYVVPSPVSILSVGKAGKNSENNQTTERKNAAVCCHSTRRLDFGSQQSRSKPLPKATPARRIVAQQKLKQYAMKARHHREPRVQPGSVIHLCLTIIFCCDAFPILASHSLGSSSSSHAHGATGSFRVRILGPTT
jgi:hypothetical protein